MGRLSSWAVAHRRGGRATWIAAGLAVLLTTLLVTAGVTSLAWGSSLREEGRLLPGTAVAGVDVGGQTLEEATAAVEDHLQPRLDREVALVHLDERWPTTARELGATSDAGVMLDEAFSHTLDAGLTELTRMRWAGASIGPDLEVALELDDEAVEAFATNVAEEVARDPLDAEVAWTSDGLHVTDGHEGRDIDVEATVAALTDALVGEADEVELVVEQTEPEVTTAAAQQAADELAPLIETALDHTVTVTHEGRTWSISPRRLDARPRLQPALEASLAGDEPDRVATEVPDETLGGFVASIASDVDVAPRNAQLDVDGERLDVTPERHGLAVDRDEATGELRAALDGEAAEVALPVYTARAAVTTASFDRVLVLRQGERMLSLYRDHERVREWPVAVGQGGSPTPRGTFTVGAKRHLPTWHNPSPNGWGSDMPASIGPGPDNPLGTRALNWNQGGRDTLIRFHGTPNEDSIGEAASQGCVRMYNADVEELYDLVDTGTMIISQG